jgi:hypothetical protein
VTSPTVGVARVDLRALLVAARDGLDRALAELDAVGPAAAEVATFMKLEDYAKRRNVGLSTVKRWRKLGLPVKAVGRVVRVVVASADKWDEHDAIRRMAERDATRGR